MFEPLAPCVSVAGLVAALADVDGAELSDPDRIELLTDLERLKSAAAAAQARVTVAFDTSQRAGARTRNDDIALRRSVASQVALARHESPVAGSRLVGLATALVREMPRTMRALTSGATSEWRATVMVRETAALTREDRAAVDAELGDRIVDMGNRRVAAEARRIGYRLDPHSLERRTRGAESDRRVSLRPAPDTMSLLTGFLPVAQGVAVHTALKRHAESLRGQGDARTLGQLMADTLVARVTGLERADAIPVEVRLVTPAGTVFFGGAEPGSVPDYGPIPASLVRRLVHAADRAWVRRLFADPMSGSLVAMSSKRTEFTGLLRDLLITRDDTCRTPWCDAPIRHLDHAERVADGGETSSGNGQGLCERCNYTKEAPGWLARPDGVGGVTTRTPTGQEHTTRPPPLLGVRPPPRVDTFHRRWALMRAA